jgi:CRISPR-associated protein Csd2
MNGPIKNRHEFTLIFDVENGNPNGDPDNGNMPRMDPETSHGLVTDVCIKRKIRNFVELVKGNTPPYEIYVKEKAILNRQHERAYINNPAVGKPVSKKLPAKEADAIKIRDWMCANFFDVRTFGAVMATEINAGQARGPVQLNFARSIEPIVPMEITITRMAVTTEKEAEKQAGGNRTMGKKYIVPYALYRLDGYVSACLAEKTGFNDADMELLWEAMMNMFDHDHSSVRGKMNTRKLVVFKHASKLGKAPAHALFALVNIERRSDDSSPARVIDDYEIVVDYERAPAGVDVVEMI